MAQIKIVKEPREIYWLATHEGIVEIDGEILEYRWSEDYNGSTLYILKDEDWCESNFENEKHEELYNAFSMLTQDDLGEVGDYLDLEEDFI